MLPMFHFTERRIEAHVCICFAAYKIYKELKRIVRIVGINLSVDEVLNVARAISTIRTRMPENNDVLKKTLFLTKKQKAIDYLFNLLALRLE